MLLLGAQRARQFYDQQIYLSCLKFYNSGHLLSIVNISLLLVYYRGHERVEDADGEDGAAGEGLGQVQLSVRVVVVIVRVKELDTELVH